MLILSCVSRESLDVVSFEALDRIGDANSITRCPFTRLGYTTARESKIQNTLCSVCSLNIVQCGNSRKMFFPTRGLKGEVRQNIFIGS